MHFDGAMNQYGNGIGVLLITRLRDFLELGVKEVEVFGDSTFVKAQAQKL